MIRRFIISALLALASALPAVAACTTGGSPLNLEIPNFSDSGSVWAGCLQRDFMKISTATALTGSTSAYSALGWIGVNRISGLAGTPNIRISSSIYVDSASSISVMGNQYIGGNLGIGTAAPGKQLSVIGGIASGEGTASDTDGRMMMSWDASGNVGNLDSYQGGYHTLNLRGSDIYLNPGAEGNVGIGVGNACSTCTLHVFGNIVASVGVRASTGIFTSSGAKQFSVTTSSGINILAGGVQWADGTISTTASGAGINIYIATGALSGVNSIQLPQEATHYFDGAYFIVTDSPTNKSSVITLNVASTTSVGTRQIFLSGSGTYNTPAGANQIRIRMVGGGGGGSNGNSDSAGPGGDNAPGTTFNSITAAGGRGGAPYGTGARGGGGTGGAGSASARSPGFPGQGACINANCVGGAGGGSLMGGGAFATTPIETTVGQNAYANSGGGGSGGFQGTVFGGGGGGGEYVEIIINSPSASYSYSVSTGANGGAYNSYTAGGTGGSGKIIVDEFYPTIGPTGATGSTGATGTAGINGTGGAGWTASGTSVFLTTTTNKVGIGTSTFYGGGQVVEIAGANAAITADAMNLFVRSKDAYGADIGGALALGGAYDTAGDITPFAEISGRKTNSTNGQYGGYFSVAVDQQGVGSVERLRIAEDGSTTLSGAIAVTGETVGTTGTPLSIISTGTYTPTLTNSSNIDSSGVLSCKYFRLGVIVDVTCNININVTISGAATMLVTLPIASNIGSGNDLVGNAGSEDGGAGYVLGNAANDAAEVHVFTTNLNTGTFGISFKYEIK